MLEHSGVQGRDVSWHIDSWLCLWPVGVPFLGVSRRIRRVRSVPVVPSLRPNVSPLLIFSCLEGSIAWVSGIDKADVA